MKTVVDIQFNALNVPGGVDAIIARCQCADAIVNVVNSEALGRIDVNIVLDETDERLAEVLALLVTNGENGWILRRDIYTENDLQAAPLLLVFGWPRYLAATGPSYGTTYDMTSACPRCGTGARQTSPLIIDDDDVKAIEKVRIAASNYGDRIIRDVDAEKIAAASLPGLSFWPIYAKKKNGVQVELRHQQIFAQHIMPPLAASSLLDRTNVCPTCRRGCFSHVSFQPRRLAYRQHDLANIQDVNLTWECFGDPAPSPEEALAGRWPIPYTLITPKVMNLLRNTGKQVKYQGVDFIPIWIDDGHGPAKPAS